MPAFYKYFEQREASSGRARTAFRGHSFWAEQASQLSCLPVFAALLSTPDLQAALQGLESSDGGRRWRHNWTRRNIPIKSVPTGKTVSVPADKLDERACRLRRKIRTPQAGEWASNFSTRCRGPDRSLDEKVAYQRAMEGELERTIQTLPMCEQAPASTRECAADSLFLDRPPGAQSFGYPEAGGAAASRSDAVVAISRLVSAAVRRIEPEDRFKLSMADSERSLGSGRWPPVTTR